MRIWWPASHMALFNCHILHLFKQTHVDCQQQRNTARKVLILLPTRPHRTEKVRAGDSSFLLARRFKKKPSFHFTLRIFPHTWCVRRPSPQDKQLTWSSWLMLTWCLLIVGGHGSLTQTWGQCLPITVVLQSESVTLQRSLCDPGHTWLWTCAGWNILFEGQGHACTFKKKIFTQRLLK